MSKKLSLVALLAAAILWIPALATPAAAQNGTVEATAEPAAEESAGSFTFGVDWASRYLFRGVALLDDEPVAIPYAKLGIGGFNLYYYGYFGEFPDSVHTLGGVRGDYQEADFGLDYTFDIGKASITAGGVTYQYNSATENELGFLDTFEVYGIVGLDFPLAPTISYYHDVDKVDGGYASLGVSHGFEFSDRLSANLTGSVGFDFQYNNKAKSDGTPNDITLGVDLPVQVSERVAIHALLQHVIALDSLDDLGRDDETVVTLGGSVSF